MHSKVFVSDNTDHSKKTIVAYLYKIFCKLPKNIKRLKIWSDGPSAQFKNKFIASILTLFEGLFPLRIVWNYFATSHGKGCVDGLGAVAKHRVRRMVLTRKAIVNSASDFVAAFNLENSCIEVSEVSNFEIDQINADLEIECVFADADPVNKISSFHQLQVENDKIMGFSTSKDGYDYINKKK